MNTSLKGYVNLWVETYHNAMFDGYWSSATLGDIKYLLCHVTLQIYLIEGSSNFEWELFIAYHQHLANFGEHGYCGSRDMFCFFCFFSIKTFITITMYKQTIYSQQKLIIDICF